MLAVSRGVALAAGAALAFTVLGATLANSFAFLRRQCVLGALVLFLALAGAIGAGLIVPLLRLNRARPPVKPSKHCPQFEQRLVTFAERAGADPFSNCWAADTLEVAARADPNASRRANTSELRHGGGCCGGRAAMAGISGPVFSAMELRCFGAPSSYDRPFYEVQVQPGDQHDPRKSDQIVTARLFGFQTGSVRVFAKFQSSSKWEEAMMRPQPGSPAFEFLFAECRKRSTTTSKGRCSSKQFRMSVADLPEVKKLA